jgi:tRNA-specific 2-thiouridylase
VARKPDSQDLCFLAGTGRRDFLARHGGLVEREGAIVDTRGHAVGRHRGHHDYTVGQRRGLGVGGQGEPLYVLRTDARKNTVTVGQRGDLQTSSVLLRDLTLHRDSACVDAVRLRYRSRALPCAVPGLSQGTHRAATVQLHEPTGAVAPGQLACLLAGDVVVGHATIADGACGDG